MPNLNIDSVKNVVTERAKDAANAAGALQNKIEENPMAKKVEDTVKDVAIDEAHRRAADKLDQADKIINNPLTKIVAGLISPDAKESVTKAGDYIKD